MTLSQWTEARGNVDRQIAALMNDWLKDCIDTGAVDVSTHAVRKYRSGQQVPRAQRMQAAFAVTGGWVTANNFFDLPVCLMVVDGAAAPCLQEQEQPLGGQVA